MPLILTGTTSGGKLASHFTVDDTNDRIGIGTTSPTVLLDLESTAPTIKFTDTDATGTPECEVSGAGGDLILRADKDNEKSSDSFFFLNISLNRDLNLSVIHIVWWATSLYFFVVPKKRTNKPIE